MQDKRILRFLEEECKPATTQCWEMMECANMFVFSKQLIQHIKVLTESGYISVQWHCTLHATPRTVLVTRELRTIMGLQYVEVWAAYQNG